MEVKEKGLSLVVGVSKKVPDIAVAMSFSFPGVASCCLKKLMCNCADGNSLMKGSHEAALAYAIFEVIRDKFVNTPLELSKSRVSNMSCRVIDNVFTINWNCQGTGSSLRKTCGIALACLNSNKLFSKYSENIKFLSGKSGDKDEFAFCVKKANEGISKYVQFAAVGKINTDDKKLKDIFKVISSKYPEIKNIGSGTAPTIPKKSDDEKAEENEIEYPLIKCSGIEAIAAADYIRSNSGGMGVEVVNDGIAIYNMSWNSKKKQLLDSRRINDYVKSKYTKLGAEFPNLFAYFALTQGYTNSYTAAQIIKSKQISNLDALIKKALK